MGWIITIDADHLVDVIILHCIDPLLNQWLVKLEAREVLGGVLFRDSLNLGLAIDKVARVLDQFAHFGVMMGRRGAHIAHIACNYTLTGDGWDKAVEE